MFCGLSFPGLLSWPPGLADFYIPEDGSREPIHSELSATEELLLLTGGRNHRTHAQVSSRGPEVMPLAGKSFASLFRASFAPSSRLVDSLVSCAILFFLFILSVSALFSVAIYSLPLLCVGLLLIRSSALANLDAPRERPSSSVQYTLKHSSLRTPDWEMPSSAISVCACLHHCSATAKP